MKIAMIILSRNEPFWIQHKVVRNWLLRPLIDNIVAMINGRICEKRVGIRMGNNCFLLWPTGSFIRIRQIPYRSFSRKTKESSMFLFLFIVPLYGWYYISELFWGCDRFCVWFYYKEICGIWMSLNMIFTHRHTRK